MHQTKPCPHCGKPVPVHRNPVPTVDTVIYQPGKGIVLIERKNAPLGWALPGGFVDYGETVEQAAVREAREETGLEVELIHLLGVYSSPERDPRKHTMSTVFIAMIRQGQIRGGDDAQTARFFALNEWPEPLVFDHGKILDHFLHHWTTYNNL